MASTHGASAAGFNATTPSSSGGARARFVTPATTATRITSGDSHTTASMAATQSSACMSQDSPPGFRGPPGSYVARGGVSNSRGQMAAVGGLSDPFVTSPGPRSKGRSELSPTATDFAPGPASLPSSAPAERANDRPSHGRIADDVTAEDSTRTSRHVMCVVNGSTSSAPAPAAPATPHSVRARANAIAGFTGNVVGTVVLHYRPESLATDGAVARVVGALLEADRRPAANRQFVLDYRVPGELRVGFFEMAVFEVYVESLRRHHPAWRQEKSGGASTALAFRAIPAVEDPARVYIVVTYHGQPGVTFNADAFEEDMHAFLRGHGELDEWRRVPLADPSSIGLVARFRDLTVARQAVATIDGCEITNVQPNVAGVFNFERAVHFRRASSDPPAMLSEAELAAAIERMALNTGSSRGRQYRYGTSSRQSDPSSVWDHTEQSTPLSGRNGASVHNTADSSQSDLHISSPSPGLDRHGIIGQQRPQAPVPGGVSRPRRRSTTGQNNRRGNDYGAGHHHNVVDINRISEGLDVRTTIMLRNIPNKIDQPMLKAIVDETSHGKYDFMYLRIDFANNCNVGYAFINFEDPYHIIDFVRARAGYRWNRFNSDKVAEISYATIQGKDCLVQKFRNSSVMLEHPSFRPKVFHTGSGPLAGTEDEFPPPDNNSKMRRSIENAAHVGLFAPGGGQNPRYDQRRRRSQYDRGTRHAQLEEAHGFAHPGIGRMALLPRSPQFPGPFYMPGLPEERAGIDIYPEYGSRGIHGPVTSGSIH